MLKKLLILVLLLGLVIPVSFTKTSNAATGVKTYGNCTALNQDYKGGVARSANVKNVGGKTKFQPFVSQAIYDANKKLDRDKDFIACEK